MNSLAAKINSLKKSYQNLSAQPVKNLAPSNEDFRFSASTKYSPNASPDLMMSSKPDNILSKSRRQDSFSDMNIVSPFSIENISSLKSPIKIEDNNLEDQVKIEDFSNFLGKSYENEGESSTQKSTSKLGTDTPMFISNESDKNENLANDSPIPQFHLSLKPITDEVNINNDTTKKVSNTINNSRERLRNSELLILNSRNSSKLKSKKISQNDEEKKTLVNNSLYPQSKNNIFPKNTNYINLKGEISPKQFLRNTSNDKSTKYRDIQDKEIDKLIFEIEALNILSNDETKKTGIIAIKKSEFENAIINTIKDKYGPVKILPEDRSAFKNLLKSKKIEEVPKKHVSVNRSITPIKNMKGVLSFISKNKTLFNYQASQKEKNQQKYEDPKDMFDRARKEALENKIKNSKSQITLDHSLNDYSSNYKIELSPQRTPSPIMEYEKVTKINKPKTSFFKDQIKTNTKILKSADNAILQLNKSFSLSSNNNSFIHDKSSENLNVSTIENRVSPSLYHSRNNNISPMNTSNSTNSNASNTAFFKKFLRNSSYHKSQSNLHTKPTNKFHSSLSPNKSCENLKSITVNHIKPKSNQINVNSLLEYNNRNHQNNANYMIAHNSYLEKNSKPKFTHDNSGYYNLPINQVSKVSNKNVALIRNILIRDKNKISEHSYSNQNKLKKVNSNKNQDSYSSGGQYNSKKSGSPNIQNKYLLKSIDSPQMKTRMVNFDDSLDEYHMGEEYVGESEENRRQENNLMKEFASNFFLRAPRNSYKD